MRVAIINLAGNPGTQLPIGAYLRAVDLDVVDRAHRRRHALTDSDIGYGTVDLAVVVADWWNHRHSDLSLITAELGLEPAQIIYTHAVDADDPRTFDASVSLAEDQLDHAAIKLATLVTTRLGIDPGTRFDELRAERKAHPAPNTPRPQDTEPDRPNILTGLWQLLWAWLRTLGR